jgi:hypothetical protein
MPSDYRNPGRGLRRRVRRIVPRRRRNHGQPDDDGGVDRRQTGVFRIVSNLGVFDFNGPEHQMRALSLHPGVEPSAVREATSFEVHGLDEADTTRLPTDAELELLKQLDPKSLRDKEVR